MLICVQVFYFRFPAFPLFSFSVASLRCSPPAIRISVYSRISGPSPLSPTGAKDDSPGQGVHDAALGHDSTNASSPERCATSRPLTSDRWHGPVVSWSVVPWSASRPARRPTGSPSHRSTNPDFPVSVLPFHEALSAEQICPGYSLTPGLNAFRKFPVRIPKGFRPRAQGCDEGATLGKSANNRQPLRGNGA